MTVSEIQTIYHKGLQAAVDPVQGLLARITGLEKQNPALGDRLQQNSHSNSTRLGWRTAVGMTVA